MHLGAAFGQGSRSPGAAFFKSADRFFNTYARSGRVDYTAAGADTAMLSAMDAQMRSFDLRGAGRIKRQAFLVNAYNFIVIRSVATARSLQSPFSTPGFFDTAPHAVAGDTVTLDEIERMLLAEADGDVRLRFLLCRGALGSPPVRAVTPTPWVLGRQIDAQLRRLFNDPAWVPVDAAKREVSLPALFSDPALGMTEVEALAFANRYRRKKIPAGYAVGYHAFNEALNEAFPLKQGSARPGREPVPPALLEDHIVSDATFMLVTPFQVRTAAVLQTHRASYNDEWDRINYKYRNTSFNMSFQFWTRVSPRFNVGVQFLTRTLRLSGFDDSPYKAITFSNDTNTAFFLRHVMNSARYLVVDRKIRVVAQTSFLVPVSRKIQVRYDNNRQRDAAISQWINEVHAMRHFSKYFSLFAGLNAVSRIGSDDAEKVFVLRGSLLSEFNLWLSRSLRLYAFLDMSPQLYTGWFSNFYLREGAGFAFRPGESVQIDFQYAYDALGKKSGAVNAFTLGGRVNW
jgi:hypothetical protein